MSVQGIQEFRDFADDIESLKSEVPSAIERGIEWTVEDFKEAVVENIQQKETTKGGTLDSRTSPYSPGGTNDSSTDSLHISEKEAWNHKKTNQSQYRVFPDPQVRDRAVWMEFGTTDHGPDGDIPMYFQVGGLTIVVSDAPPDASLEEQFRAEPGEVEGVESQLYFKEAAEEVNEETLADNIEKSLKLAAQKHVEI